MSGIITQNVLGSSGLVKAVAAAGGTWVEIKALTSGGSDDTISFVNGTSDVVLDSTYPIYCFRFINIHPETENEKFAFNVSIDTGSNYNVAKTTGFFYAIHTEDDGTTQVDYDPNKDLAQGTGTQPLTATHGTGNDEGLSGYLYLYNPASTVFVKTFLARTSGVTNNPAAMDNFTGGYANTTSAVDAVQFSMSSGEIQGGEIKLFGIKDSL